jgi:hypothetical protein
VGSNQTKAVRIYKGKKILSTPSFGGEVKPSVQCGRFVACKRSLNVTCKSAFRQNYRPSFSPTVPPFAARISRIVRTWRHLAAEVGTSKPPGVVGVPCRDTKHCVIVPYLHSTVVGWVQAFKVIKLPTWITLDLL